MIEQFLHPRIVEALGWTLLHALWQGALFALLLAVLLIALRSYTAQARYTVAVGLLAAFFLTSGSTFYTQWQQVELLPTSATEGRSAGEDSFSAVAPLAPVLGDPSTKDETNQATTNSPATPAQASSTQHWLAQLERYYSKHLPLLVTLWLMGVLVLQLRWLGQLAYVQRLKHFGTEAFPAAWKDRIKLLEDKLRLQKQVHYATTLRTSSPLTVGWLKPVVLFPRLMLERLTETEVYAVLAHEMAHIRRDDFLVNLVQTFLTNVFFFHPGVWWMSSRIDDEREHCCDDLAIEATGGALPYAKSLLSVSELQAHLLPQKQAQLALALTGKPSKRNTGFADRVKRLFTTTSGTGTFREGFATACILLFALVVGVVATGQTGHQQPSFEAGLQREQPLETKSLALDETGGTAPVPTDVIPPLAPPQPPGPNTIIPEADLASVENLEAVADSPTQAVPEEHRVEQLIWAASRGELKEVKALVATGLSINSVGSSGFTPLMAAASENELEVARYLLDKGADPDLMSNSWTALMEAADEGAFEVLTLLLTRGASANLHDGEMAPTAAAMAASENHLQCLQALLHAGAALNANSGSYPLLHAAAEEGHVEIVAFLIDQKIDLEQRDAGGRTALMYAAHEGKQRVAKTLLEAGADLSASDQEGNTAADYATLAGNPSLRALLMGSPTADPTADPLNLLGISTSKLPRLHQLTIDGRVEEVERLVNQGSNVNQQDRGGRSPLHLAALLNYNLDLERLIALDGDKNMRDRKGRTPLMYAAMAGQLASARLLVTLGADASMADVKGQQAIDYARAGGAPDLVALLNPITDPGIAAGRSQQTDPQTGEIVYLDLDDERFPESPTTTNRPADKSALEVLFTAAANGDLVVLEQQLQSGVNPNDRNVNDETALMRAAQRGQLATVKTLIAYGGDVNVATSSGLTALHLATLERQADMVKLLLANQATVDSRMNFASSDGSPDNELVAWSYEGATPLLVAVEGNSTQLAKLLLAAGANPNARMAKVEYRKRPGSKPYLDRTEVVGQDDYFKHEAVGKRRVADWSPAQQARQQGKPEMIALF